MVGVTFDSQRSVTIEFRDACWLLEPSRGQGSDIFVSSKENKMCSVMYFIIHAAFVGIKLIIIIIIIISL